MQRIRRRRCFEQRCLGGASTSSGSGGAMPADFSIACQEQFMSYCVEYTDLTGSQDETVQTRCACNHGIFVAHCPTKSLLGICARLVPTLGVGVTDKEFYYAFDGLDADSVESACKGAGGMWTPAADAGT